MDASQSGNTTEPQARLKRCTSLPSPPGIAFELISLCEDPDVDFDQFHDLVTKDPSLTARLLKVANSPVYGGMRQTNNLRQALLLFGINGILNLALSFTLANGLRNFVCKGVDLERFWRRSLAVAVATRQVAKRARPLRSGDLYLAGLLQDIGILALARVYPEIYADHPEQVRHHGFYCDCEKRGPGVDHALAGSWLLAHWNLPDWLVQAVAGSHGEPGNSGGNELAECLITGARIEEMMHKGLPPERMLENVDAVRRHLQIEDDELIALIESVSQEFQFLVPQFNLPPGEEYLREDLVEHAAELMQLRSLRHEVSMANLRDKNRELEDRARQLQEKSCRDALTGLYNREHLDNCAADEFVRANKQSWPLSVLFVDVDDFKRVNDCHGHASGDAVLVALARVLQNNARQGDIVARYGGEEFVVLLAGPDSAGARVVGQRLVEAIRTTDFRAADGARLRLTTSIGLATQNDSQHFRDVGELLASADKSLYLAKNQGKNRLAVYKQGRTA